MYLSSRAPYYYTRAISNSTSSPITANTSNTTAGTDPRTSSLPVNDAQPSHSTRLLLVLLPAIGLTLVIIGLIIAMFVMRRRMRNRHSSEAQQQKPTTTRNLSPTEMLELLQITAPVKKFEKWQKSKTKKLHHQHGGGNPVASSEHFGLEYQLSEQLVCAICLDDFHPRHTIRELPLCHHTFHRECIDRWVFQGRAVCPVCKAEMFAIEGNKRDAKHVENVGSQTGGDGGGV